jgi:CHAD domain-containing protein
MSGELPAVRADYLAGKVRSARRHYSRQLARGRKKFSSKAVHDLRVELRRALALLDLIDKLKLSRSVKKVRRQVKKRLDAFDELRDTHVHLQLLEPLWPAYPEARPLRKCLCRAERRLSKKVAAGISAGKYDRVESELKRIEKDLGRSDACCPADGVLRDAFGDVERLRRGVRRSDASTIHRLRVGFKRFRYMTELMRPLLPDAVDPYFSRMKKYQAMAGHIQDLEVLLARLGQHLEDLGLAVIGRLRKELLRRKRVAISSFMARIDDLAAFTPLKLASRNGREGDGKRK